MDELNWIEFNPRIPRKYKAVQRTPLVYQILRLYHSVLDLVFCHACASYLFLVGVGEGVCVRARAVINLYWDKSNQFIIELNWI